MAATKFHVLKSTDVAFKAFFDAAGIADLPAAAIVRNKESADKELPILICSAEEATRTRAKNWTVTGSLILKTFAIDADNTSNLDASDDMETAVLEALETYVPDDDRPQPLAAAIQAAAVTAGVLSSDTFLMVDCRILRCSQGFDEDGLWTLSVDYTASVIAIKGE